MDRDTSRRSGCIRMTEKQAAAAASRHELLYSGRMGGARAIFAFCDLSGLDLSGRDLADADFTGAYLEETNFSDARLDSAILLGASLDRANLSGASLRRADMRGSALDGANLIGADLCEADFGPGSAGEKNDGGSDIVNITRPAEMRGTLFANANLERARLPNVIAIQADFTDAQMRHCNLAGAQLSRARMAGANLESADLSGSDLSGADLKGVVLAGAKLERALLDGAEMKGALTDALAGRAVSELGEAIGTVLTAHGRWPKRMGAKALRRISKGLICARRVRLRISNCAR